MERIAQLKAQHRALKAEIKQAEDDERKRVRTEILASDTYVKVVCPECEGRGEIARQGAGGNDDFYEETCNKCSGEGFLYAVRFKGRKREGYDMTYAQVCAPY